MKKKKKVFRIKLIQHKGDVLYIIQRQVSILGIPLGWTNRTDPDIPMGPYKVINLLQLREAFPSLESAIIHLASLYRVDPTTLVCTKCYYQL